MLGLFALSAPAETLRDFQPSAVESPHGKVSKIEYKTGLVEVGGGYLAHSPAGAVRTFHFDEPVWIIGYKTEIYDSTGGPPKENYLCHTYFGEQRFAQMHSLKTNAIYSDAFTREVSLPQGFGLQIAANEDLHWLPLFNNRSKEPTRVGMRVEITLIRDKDIVKPLRRLYATLQSVQMPHLFFVPPKRHQQQTVFRLDFDGRIHFMGTHIHPHGESMELYNLAREEQVWKGNHQTNAAGEMVGFDVYSSVKGYPVRAGENFRLTSVYDNPKDHEIDAMAGLFVFYSVE